MILSMRLCLIRNSTFQSLPEQFAAVERNFRVAQSAEQRAELLKRMNAVIVIEELDQLILANQSSLNSKLASISPPVAPIAHAETQERTKLQSR
jgi:hypothetical protein